MAIPHANRHRRKLDFDQLERRDVPAIVPVTGLYELGPSDHAWIEREIEALPTAGDSFTGSWVVGLAEDVEESDLLVGVPASRAGALKRLRPLVSCS